MSIQCSGCGVSLQMERVGEKGYATGAAFAREHPLCQRCFRLIHYGELTPVSVTSEEYRETLTKALLKPSLILYVVDLFDFNGSLVKGISSLLKGHEIVMAVNKFDLFPNETRPEKARRWIVREAKKQDLEVKEAVVVSAKSGTGIIDLYETLKERYRGRTIVVVGMANVGKSSVLNALIKVADQDEGQKLTTSLYPGTTIGIVSITFTGMTMIDTPGLLGTFRMVDRVCAKSLAQILPDAPLKPRVFQLTPEQTLFLGGLARIDFTKGEPQSFVVYVANQLNVHRTKIERANEMHQQHVGELLTPPCENCATDLRKLIPRRYHFDPGNSFDLVISGLGFVRLSGQMLDLVVHVPQGVEVTIRLALISKWKSDSRDRGGVNWHGRRNS